MAQSPQHCPDCGSANVVEDEHYSQTQLVCSDCGSVLTEGLLTTCRSEEQQGTAVKFHQRTERNKEPCRNQIKGLRRVRALSRAFRLPKPAEESAQSLYTRAYEHEEFLRTRIQKKEALAGCCVLLSCRQFGVPVAMGTVAALLEAEPCVMGSVFTRLVKTLRLDSVGTDITRLLEGHCAEYRLASVPEEYRESAACLCERAALLLELAADTWLVTGRHPVPMLVAAVYLSWLSLRPCPQRLRVTLPRFCRMAQVPLPGPTAKRVSELRTVLCRLSCELPWLKGREVEPKGVATVVGDIVKHRITLLRKALRSHEEVLASDGPASCDPARSPGPASCDPARSPGPASCDPARSPGPASCDPARSPGPASCDPARSPDPACDPARSPGPCDPARPPGPTPPDDTEWGKRELFVPPCVTRPRRKRARLSPHVEVTGDEEISDSEIESYLRSPSEVRQFKHNWQKVQALGESTSEEED